MAKARKPTARQRKLAEAAAGRENPTQKQQQAIDVCAAYDTEQAALALLREFPKTYYVDWSGRQVKVLHAQADTWGAPIRGDSLDLTAVIRWFHDFIAEQSPKLRRAGDGDDWVEQERKAKYHIRRLDLLEKSGRLIPVENVRDLNGRLIAALRNLGDRLERQFGGDARDLLNETLEALRREIEAAPVANISGMDDDDDGL